MRILLATPDFPLWDGGISTVSHEIATGLQRCGHDVSVFAPLQDPGDRDFDATLPLKVFRIKNIKDHYLKMYYHNFKMNQLVKKMEFDLVMAQSWYPSGIAARKMATRHKIKMTVTVHGNEILNPRYHNRFWQKKMLRVFDKANKIFCVSKYTREKLSQKIGHLTKIEKKFLIVYNGVDFHRFLPSSPDEELMRKYNLKDFKIILTLARLVERKGHDMVIHSLCKIKKNFPRIKYIICGRGNNESRLKQLVNDLNLNNSVIFAGFIPDELKVKFYNLCDIYIMPSREILEKGDLEGFGITYLEANACEKPVIGSRGTGAEEAIDEGKSGFLVNPFDSEEIAEKCLTLLSRPDLSKNIGQYARKRVIQEFNWDVSCRQIDRYLTTLKAKN
jgi:phosphatidylinositol alpha-1,6-mannosyltransferase